MLPETTQYQYKPSNQRYFYNFKLAFILTPINKQYKLNCLLLYLKLPTQSSYWFFNFRSRRIRNKIKKNGNIFEAMQSHEDISAKKWKCLSTFPITLDFLRTHWGTSQLHMCTNPSTYLAFQWDAYIKYHLATEGYAEKERK